VDVVKLLLSANARVDTADPNLDRPLHYACQEGNPEVVKVLLVSKVHVDVFKITDCSFTLVLLTHMLLCMMTGGYKCP